MQRGWKAAWLVLLAVMSWPAGACALRVELLQSPPGLDGPPLAAPVLQRVEAAEAVQALRIPLSQRQSEHWLRLRCDGALPPDASWSLVMQGAQRLGEVTFYPPGALPRRVLPAAQLTAPSAALLRQGWVLPLPNGWPASSTAYLRLKGLTTEPALLRLARADELVRERRAASRSAIAVFTVLTLVALAMLGIYARFRDLLYLSYAGYLVCLALYLVLLSGDAAQLPLLSNFIAHGTTGQWALATLAVTLQIVFTGRILEMKRTMPRGARALRVLFWLHVALLITLLIGRTRVHGWYYLAGNGLLVLGAPLTLALAVLAWRRGVAYAGYYLLGWVPMLALAMLTAANQLGLVPAPWAEHHLPTAAVFESLVLAVALSRHAAHRHRIARLARDSLDRDALTGAPNGEALERMLESWRHLGALGAPRYSLLLLQLDDLAGVHARHGRAVADAALQQVLARMRSVLRAEDTVARVGRDMFAVVSPYATHESEALARRVVGSIASAPLQIDAHTLELGASVGLAISDPGEPAAALMQRARDALHRTRGLGRSAIGIAPGPRPVRTMLSPQA